MPVESLRVEIEISDRFLTPTELIKSAAQKYLESAKKAVQDGNAEVLKVLLAATYYTVTQEEFQSNYNAPQDTAAVSHLRRESEDHLLFGFTERRVLIQYALKVQKFDIARDIFNDLSSGVDVRFKIPELNEAFVSALNTNSEKNALAVLKAEACLAQFEAASSSRRRITEAERLSILSKNLEAFKGIIANLGLSSKFLEKVEKMEQKCNQLQQKLQAVENHKSQQCQADLALLKKNLEDQKKTYEEKKSSFSLPGQSSASQKLHEVKLMLAEVTRLERVLKGEDVAALSRWTPGMAAKDGTLFKSELKPFADSLASVREKIETALAPRTSSEWVFV